MDLQAFANRVGAVVGALAESRAAFVADPGLPRRLMDRMIGRFAFGAGPAAAQALDDFLVVDAKKQDGAQVQKLLPLATD